MTTPTPHPPASNDQQAFYDDFWSRTEDQRIHGPLGRHTRRLIESALSGLDFKSVLDAGCGEGTMIAQLFRGRTDLRIVGTDISPSALAMAARKNPGAEFKPLDFRQGPLPEKFDLVILSEVIEHLEDDEGAVRCLAAMTGRYLLITTLGGRMRSHEKDLGHQRNYDPRRLVGMVEAAGLKKVRLIQWGWPFFSPLYRDLLELMGTKTRDMTTGSFGPGRKLLALLIHTVFFLNSWRKGDQLVLLAERPKVPQPLPADPKISVVIPVRNEEKFMRACIASLRAVKYPADRLEIIFADGESTDRTAAIARELGCTVVPNPGRNVAAGRNAGFAAARGDIVVFSDADCLFHPEWLERACRHFATHPWAAGLSGPTQVPADQNAFGKAIGVMFELAGLLGTTVHHDRVDGVRAAEDLPGCNAIYRREALEAVMPRGTALGTNEDVEMNDAIRRAGFRLMMTPDVGVEHYKRTSASGLWKQMYRFAVGRVTLGRTNPALLKPGHWAVGVGAPIVALAIGVGGLYLPLLWWLALGSVVAALAAAFVFTAIRHSFGVALRTPPVIVITVLAWVSGFLSGWISTPANALPASTETGALFVC